jgi:hypothetical protein
MNTYQNQGLSLKGMVIQLLATKAIDEHLQTLPSMVVNSINKTSAIAQLSASFVNQKTLLPLINRVFPAKFLTSLIHQSTHQMTYLVCAEFHH